MSLAIKRKFDDGDDRSRASSLRASSQDSTPSEAKRSRQDRGPPVAIKLFSETPEPQLRGSPSVQVQPRLPKIEAASRHAAPYITKYRGLYNDEIRDVLRPSDTLDFRDSNLQESQIGGTKWSVGEKERFFGATARYGTDLGRIAATVGKTVPEVSLYTHLLDEGAKKNRALGFDADLKDIPAAAHMPPNCRRALEYGANSLAWYQFKKEIVEEIRWHGQQWLITGDSDDKDEDVLSEGQESGHIGDEQASEADEDAGDEQSEESDHNSTDVHQVQNDKATVDDDDVSMGSDSEVDIPRPTREQQGDFTDTLPPKQPLESTPYQDSELGAPPTAPDIALDDVSQSEADGNVQMREQTRLNPSLSSERVLFSEAIDPNLPDFSVQVPSTYTEETHSARSPSKPDGETEAGIPEKESKLSKGQPERTGDASDSEHEPASDAESNPGANDTDEPDSWLPLLDDYAMLQLSKCVFMNSAELDMRWSTHLNHFFIPKEHLPHPLTGPAIFRTAYDDLTRVVTMLTKRLVATAQCQAQSRMRMIDNLHKPAAKYVTVEKCDVRAAADILGLKRNAFGHWAGLPKRHAVHWEFGLPKDQYSAYYKEKRITPQAAEACLRSRGPWKSRFNSIIARVHGEMDVDSEDSEVDEDAGDREDEENEANPIEESLDDTLEAMIENTELEQLDQENSTREEKKMLDIVGGLTDDYWRGQAKAQGAWPLHQGLYN